MKKLIQFFVFIFPVILFAGVAEEWVVQYNGLGDWNDEASAIAVDDEGNVYVTGKCESPGTYYDYVTIKYDKDGNELWVKRYNGSWNDNDEASAIVVDDEGNVYVTGWSLGASTGRDYATIKYDKDGNELWVKRYDGTVKWDDVAYSIAIDNEGNVYVTGKSRGNNTRYDYTTLKYDKDGNELWLKRYNDPGNGWDNAYSIAVDNYGNVYVTGVSNYDYVTIKYNNDGNELWLKRYNGSGNGYDEASAIAVDDEGNVYVTGISEGSGASYDYVTIKYDKNGNELWVARYDGSVHNDDEPPSIAVDNYGNVYVTGVSEGSGTSYDYVTIKYDKNGNELWVARYDGPAHNDDEASAIAVDDEGNVYVTGISEGSGASYDYVTIKYDKDGNELWMTQYNGSSYRSSIVIDNNGNVYVGGTCEDVNTGHDYVVIKYSQSEGIKETKPPSKFSFSFTKFNLTNNEVVIKYQLPFTTNFSISVYDVSGRLVKTIAEGKKNAGTYSVKWYGKDLYDRDVFTGIYFIRFETDDYKSTEKVILMK